MIIASEASGTGAIACHVSMGPAATPESVGSGFDRGGDVVEVGA